MVGCCARARGRTSVGWFRDAFSQVITSCGKARECATRNNCERQRCRLSPVKAEAYRCASVVATGSSNRVVRWRRFRSQPRGSAPLLRTYDIMTGVALSVTVTADCLVSRCRNSFATAEYFCSRRSLITSVTRAPPRLFRVRFRPRLIGARRLLLRLSRGNRGIREHF